MPPIREGARRMFESPRAPWVIVAIALAVALPSIQLGFFNDDHAFRAALAGTLPGAPPAWDLYRFATGDEEANRELVSVGVFPWWTAPTFKLHLVRPLAGLLFALDERLFGASSLGHHLHSIAWYLALVAVVGWVLRAIVSRSTANLAMLVYALSAAHFFPYAWISCRHMIVAALPALLGLGAYLRDGTPGRKRGRWLFALGLAAGLAGGESALGVAAFPVALALVGERVRTKTALVERARSSLPSLAPALAVVAAYLVLYVAIGGGAKDCEGYVDPFSGPARFAAKAAVLLPVMLANAFFGVPAEVANIVPAAPLAVVATIGVAVVAALARACVSAMSDDERAALPWLLVGATLALLPALGGFPGARILLVPNVGFALLLAVVVRRGLGGRRVVVRAGAGLLAVIHLVLAPLMGLGNASMNARISREVETIAASAEIGPGRPRVFVIGVSDPEVTMYVQAASAATEPEKLSCWSVMSASRQTHTITRTSEVDLVLRPNEGPMLRGPFESLYRAEHVPFRVGDEARQCGATYRVTAVDAGRPTEVEIHFDRSLDDPSIRLLAWRDGRLKALSPPRIGESVEIGWAPGPLGAF